MRKKQIHNTKKENGMALENGNMQKLLKGETMKLEYGKERITLKDNTAPHRKVFMSHHEFETLTIVGLISKIEFNLMMETRKQKHE